VDHRKPQLLGNVMTTNTHIIVGILLISIGIEAIAVCMVAASSDALHLPSGFNWFAVAMIALNIGAAVWGYRTSGVNQLVYGLAAAVLNFSVYFNFDKIIGMVKGIS